MVQELNRRGATTIGYVRDRGRHLSRRDDRRPSPTPPSMRARDYETLLRAINEHEADTACISAPSPSSGIANRNPRSTFEANIRGTWNLLDACRELGAQVNAHRRRLLGQGLWHGAAPAL